MWRKAGSTLLGAALGFVVGWAGGLAIAEALGLLLEPAVGLTLATIGVGTLGGAIAGFYVSRRKRDTQPNCSEEADD